MFPQKNMCVMLATSFTNFLHTLHLLHLLVQPWLTVMLKQFFPIVA